MSKSNKVLVCKCINICFGFMEINCLNVTPYAGVNFSLATDYAPILSLLRLLPAFLPSFSILTASCLALFKMVHTSNFQFLIFHFCLCSKSTLTPVTTTWLRQRSRTSSCRQQRRRRRRLQATTSPRPRTCHRGNLLWWPANWQADANATSAASPAPAAAPSL